MLPPRAGPLLPLLAGQKLEARTSADNADLILVSAKDPWNF
jgi:hypothetical protein